AKRMLRDAILERMKTDDDKPGAGFQAPRRRVEESIEAVEFAVDPDANRLKGARRRIDPHVAAARHGSTDDRRETAGRRDRLLAPGLDDGAGDAAGKTFLAVLVNRVGEIPFRR